MSKTSLADTEPNPTSSGGIGAKASRKETRAVTALSLGPKTRRGDAKVAGTMAEELMEPTMRDSSPRLAVSMARLRLLMFRDQGVGAAVSRARATTEGTPLSSLV
jgi:hypothetical protein